MATRTFCDRCGKETVGKRTIELNLSIVNKKFDVCAKCAADFEIFIMQHKNEITERLSRVI
jgi:hypothetical protein